MKKFVHEVSTYYNVTSMFSLEICYLYTDYFVAIGNVKSQLEIVLQKEFFIRTELLIFY